MRIRSNDTLKLSTSDQPRATIEIDLDSIPDGESLQSLLSDALSNIENVQEPSTLHAHFTQSVNFHEPTSSVFVMAVGGKDVLNQVHGKLTRVRGLRMRYSDFVAPTRGKPFAYLEDGTVWLPLDDENWYADVEKVVQDAGESADEIDVAGDDGDVDWGIFEDEDDADADADADADNTQGTKTRSGAPLRTRAARSDASIGAITRTIERLFSLPEGSVLLCGPDKRALRRDASIATLRRRWE